MHVFGLTGGLASGKSTVAARFTERGVPVIDADQLARDVVAPGSEGLTAVVAAFGDGVLEPNGALDRKSLAARIFAEPKERARLEAILHPRIHALMQERAALLERGGAPLACYQAPLLVEVGLAERMRPLVVVAAEPEEQLRRAMARDGASREEAERRLGAQLALSEKVARADFVIKNRGSLADLVAEADTVLDHVLDRVGIPKERYPRP
jgi:dephospho-CoA kinase